MKECRERWSAFAKRFYDIECFLSQDYFGCDDDGGGRRVVNVNTYY